MRRRPPRPGGLLPGRRGCDRHPAGAGRGAGRARRAGGLPRRERRARPQRPGLGPAVGGRAGAGGRAPRAVRVLRRAAVRRPAPAGGEPARARADRDARRAGPRRAAVLARGAHRRPDRPAGDGVGGRGAGRHPGAVHRARRSRGPARAGRRGAGGAAGRGGPAAADPAHPGGHRPVRRGHGRSGGGGGAERPARAGLPDGAAAARGAGRRGRRRELRRAVPRGDDRPDPAPVHGHVHGPVQGDPPGVRAALPDLRADHRDAGGRHRGRAGGAGVGVPARRPLGLPRRRAAADRHPRRGARRAAAAGGGDARSGQCRGRGRRRAGHHRRAAGRGRPALPPPGVRARQQPGGLPPGRVPGAGRRGLRQGPRRLHPQAAGAADRPQPRAAQPRVRADRSGPGDPGQPAPDRRAQRRGRGALRALRRDRPRAGDGRDGPDPRRGRADRPAGQRGGAEPFGADRDQEPGGVPAGPRPEGAWLLQPQARPARPAAARLVQLRFAAGHDRPGRRGRLRLGQRLPGRRGHLPPAGAGPPRVHRGLDPLGRGRPGRQRVDQGVLREERPVLRDEHRGGRAPLRPGAQPGQALAVHRAPR